MSHSATQKPVQSDPTKQATNALAAVEIAALTDAQLRRLHAALTYMHETLAKETQRRAEADRAGDTVRVESARVEAE